MKTIEIINPDSLRKKIKFGRIKPFQNICKVTGVKEWVNVEVEYIPRRKYIDIVDYRLWFQQDFNLLIEDIAERLFKEITTSAEPEWLKITIYLEGNPNLTDWSVTICSDER